LINFSGVALILAARRWRLGRGNTFALYAMGYTVGRFWIEAMRSDYAHRFFGLRLNDWASIIVFVGALAWFLRHRGVYDESPYTRARAKTLEEDPDDEPPDEESPPDDKADKAADDKADEAVDDKTDDAADAVDDKADETADDKADEDAVSAPEGSDRR